MGSIQLYVLDRHQVLASHGFLILLMAKPDCKGELTRLETNSNCRFIRTFTASGGEEEAALREREVHARRHNPGGSVIRFRANRGVCKSQRRRSNGQNQAENKVITAAQAREAGQEQAGSAAGKQSEEYHWKVWHGAGNKLTTG